MEEGKWCVVLDDNSAQLFIKDISMYHGKNLSVRIFKKSITRNHPLDILEVQLYLIVTEAFLRLAPIDNSFRGCSIWNILE